MKQMIKIETGQKFGKLTVIKEVEGTYYGKYRHRNTLCLCDCGKKTIVKLDYLINGHTKSCGCKRVEELLKHRKTHGYANKRLYRIWCGMLSRCRNKMNHSYKNYGGKGIIVCGDWVRFENFLEWAMNNGYRENLTIERKDFDGNYCTENCSWITKPEQSKNRRNVKKIIFNELKIN